MAVPFIVIGRGSERHSDLHLTVGTINDQNVTVRPCLVLFDGLPFGYGAIVAEVEMNALGEDLLPDVGNAPWEHKLVLPIKAER